MIREIFDDAPVAALDAEKIRRGECLAPGEAIIWQGGPRVWQFARRAFHVPLIAGYFLVLQTANAWQAYRQAMPLEAAVRASLPLLIVSLVALAIFAGIAIFASRTTRYTVTDRRVILSYGIAMPATLSIPFSRIASLSVSVHPDQTGNIALKLTRDNHIGFLKLWPHARPWRLKHPEPALRCIPHAGMVAALATRAIGVAMHQTVLPGAPTEMSASTPDQISSFTCA